MDNFLKTRSRPITSLDTVDSLVKEMQVNIINRPYIGSVCNSVESEASNPGEHFFYI